MRDSRRRFEPTLPRSAPAHVRRPLRRRVELLSALGLLGLAACTTFDGLEVGRAEGQVLGRFPLDAGAGGHMDLGGVMMELTASPGDTTDPQYGPKLRWSRAGSWEGHAANSKLWQFAVMTKYGKTGMRCARD